METGGPAFPIFDSYRSERIADGMTLRDYFAAKAMQGIVSRDSNYDAFADLVEDAYALADAMIEARSAHK